MIKKLILALLFCFCCSVSYAEDININWAANSETNIAGYKIHYGTTEGVYTDIVDVGNVLTYTLPLNVGKYYITITAYDTNTPMNESDYSYILVYTVMLGKVKGIGIS